MQEFAGQRPFCKRTCKRDAAESVEQEETGKMQGEASATSAEMGRDARDEPGRRRRTSYGS